MPQLDLSTYTSQIFWLAICFCFLLFFSMKVSLPRLARALEERWAKIEGTQEISDKLRKDAEAVTLEYEGRLFEARKKAHDEIAKTSRKLGEQHTKDKAAIFGEIKRAFRDQEEVIGREKRSAMGDVQGIAQNVTEGIVNCLIPGRGNLKNVSEAVSESIKKRAMNDF